MRKNFIAIVLCCLLAACSSSNTINSDVKTGENSAVETEITETAEDVSPIEVANVGEEHNEALQILMDAFYHTDHNFDEIFELWISLMDAKSSSLGYSLSEDEINLLREQIYPFYLACQNQSGIEIALRKLISNSNCNENFKEELYSIVNNINSYETIEDLREQIGIIEENIINADYADEYTPYIQSIYNIADASYEYWTVFYYEKGEIYTAPSDSTEVNEKREEHLKELSRAIVDALAGAGISSTGVGIALSGVAGAVASFLFAEAMDYAIM